MTREDFEDLQLGLVLMRLIENDPKNADLGIKAAADKLDKSLAEVEMDNV